MFVEQYQVGERETEMMEESASERLTGAATEWYLHSCVGIVGTARWIEGRKWGEMKIRKEDKWCRAFCFVFAVVHELSAKRARNDRFAAVTFAGSRAARAKYEAQLRYIRLYLTP